MTTTTIATAATTTTTQTNTNGKTPPILKRSTTPKSTSNNNIDMWKQIEVKIQENLDNFELSRKFCAYCGRNDNYENLARCYGCQMVYYCSQEHQLNDWLEHMQKCAELEWVSLGELIQSIPAPPTICELGQYWAKSILDVQTWTDWFDMRPHILKIARNTAKIFDHIKNFNKKREPSYEDIIDGLLAAVTDSMTYSLTIGNALVKIGINPCVRPVCIHCLYSTNDFNLTNIDLIKKQFNELCNMFPGCKGFEIVFIGTDINTNEINEPFMKIDQKYLPRNQLLYISGWHGTYTSYIKYQCQIEGYSLPDLIVSFHPNFTSSPYKLINEWTDDLKIILINNFSCLFTFYDSDEKLKAYNTLNAFQTNILYAQLNQFSSLLMKQLINKPNHVYANNSYYIIIRGFIDTELDLRYKQQQQLLQQPQQQANASVQTIGINEPENQSLKHVNGKLHIQTSNRKFQLDKDSDEMCLPIFDYNENQQNNDKIAYRPVNFLKQSQQQQQLQLPVQPQQFKNSEINDNYVKKYLNSGFQTPSSETSGSYYQPRLNLTLNSSNHNHYHKTEDHDSTDETKFQKQRPPSHHHHHHHSRKLQKSKSLQKIEIRNVNDDAEDEDDSSNENELIANEQYHTLPAPKPRNYGVVNLNDENINGNYNNEEKPSVKPRKPKPKPRTIVSNSDEIVADVVTKSVNTSDETSTFEPKPVLLNKKNESEIKLKRNESIQTSSKTSSTRTSPTIINNPKRSITSPKSPRSPPSTSTASTTTSSFVSQMKSIFEQQSQNQHSNFKPFVPSSKTQIQNLTAKLANSTSSPLFKLNSKPSPKDEEIEHVQEPEPPVSEVKLELNGDNHEENEYMNIDNIIEENNKFQTIDDLNNSAVKSQQQQQQQALIMSEFRILDVKHYELQRQRSLTPSNKSLTFSMTNTSSTGVFIRHIPDPVDVVNIKYEGERRVLVPGYLTSADILRNSLISNANKFNEDNNNISLKDKLRQQQIEQEKPIKTSTVMMPQIPAPKNLITPTAIHLNNKQNDLNNEQKSLTQSKTLPDIGANSLFQKINKEVDRDDKFMLSQSIPALPSSPPPPPPPPPPPLPAQFIEPKVSTPQSIFNLPQRKQSLSPIKSLQAAAEQFPKISTQKQLELSPPASQRKITKVEEKPFQPFTNTTNTFLIAPKATEPESINNDELYSVKPRSKSMSGVFKLDDNKMSTKAVINFDLIDDDYSFEVKIEPEKPLVKNEIEIENLLPKLEMPIDTQSIASDQYDYNNKIISKESEVNKTKIYAPVRQPPPPPVPPPQPPMQQTHTPIHTPQLASPVNQNMNVQTQIPPPQPPVIQRTRVNEPSEAHYAVSPLVQESNPIEKNIEKRIRQSEQPQQRKESVTGSFDPNDFDSFDEGDTFCSNRTSSSQIRSQSPIELPKIEIPSSAPPNLVTFRSPTVSPVKQAPPVIQVPQTAENINGENTTGRFDPNDFDSFDEEEREPREIQISQTKAEEIEQANTEEYNLNYFNSNKISSFKPAAKQGSFFRNALNRLSTSKNDSKKRSSSVPPSKILNEFDDEAKKQPKQQQNNYEENNTNIILNGGNMKTLQLMNKMQIEHEEKQKRKKLRLLKQQQEQQQQQQQQQQEQPKTPKSEKKFLNTLMSSLFANNKANDNSSSSYEHHVTTTSTANSIQKNDNKRLSLRKLKAKDKAKKQVNKADGDLTSDSEANSNQQKSHELTNSSQSLNFYRNPDNDDDAVDKSENENNSPSTSYTRSASFDTSTLQSRMGKISDNNSKKVGGNEKLDLMKQIRAELDEEIKSRFAVENANKQLNAESPKQNRKQQPQPLQHRSRQSVHERRNFENEAMKNGSGAFSSNESNSMRVDAANRKIRSKSVTFLDEITTDDEVLNNPQLNRNSLNFLNTTNDDCSTNENNDQQTPNSTTTRRKALLKTGDARYHCGALTGIGPIRSIMKKSATDLSITLNTPLSQNDNLPRIELNLLDISTSATPQISPTNRQYSPVKSTNSARSAKKIQSDL